MISKRFIDVPLNRNDKKRAVVPNQKTTANLSGRAFQTSSRDSAERFFELDPLPLRGVDLAFTPFARLFEMLMLLHVGYDSRFFAGFLEPLKRFLERLLLTNNDPRHPELHPPFELGYKARTAMCCIEIGNKQPE